MLRRLMHRYPAEYGYLAFTAQEENPPPVPKNWVLSEFARRPLWLGPHEAIDAHRHQLLVELLGFDREKQQLQLIKPWR
jgi:hypothetical protein